MRNKKGKKYNLQVSLFIINVKQVKYQLVTRLFAFVCLLAHVFSLLAIAGIGCRVQTLQCLNQLLQFNA